MRRPTIPPLAGSRLAFPALALLLTISLLSIGGAPARGQDSILPRLHHEWGQFQPGATKSVRTTTETLDADGRVVNTSVTETTTTLLDADDSAASLRVEVTVEVAGNRFVKRPQDVTLNYSGAIRGRRVTIKHMGPGSVTFDGVKIPCELRQIVVEADDARWTSTIHYSDQIAPYVLERETIVTDPDGNESRYQTSVQVVSLGMPHKVKAEIKTAALIKTVHQSPRGKTITLEVRCEDVPGGVVSHTSKELDTEGRVIRRSTLELIDYDGMQIDQSPTRAGIRRLFHRRRMLRQTP